MIVSFPTVDAIGTEFFRGKAPYVNYTIPAGALDENKVYEFIFERNITNGVIAFANVFKSPSPDTMDNTIVHCKGRGYSLVPYDHAIIHYYNQDHLNDGKAITENSIIGSNLDQDVKIPTDEVMKYLEIAKNGNAQKFSFGNVTTDMIVVLSVPEPTESKVSAMRLNGNTKDSKKSASSTFKGFADSDYFLGKNASVKEKEKFMDTPFKFDMRITCEYVKLDGKEIEFIK